MINNIVQLIYFSFIKVSRKENRKYRKRKMSSLLIYQEVSFVAKFKA